MSSTSTHPFAADVSDEAGPDTTGATAGHVDETDLLDPSVPLDPGRGLPTRTSRACEHVMAVTDTAHADGLRSLLTRALGEHHHITERFIKTQWMPTIHVMGDRRMPATLESSSSRHSAVPGLNVTLG